MRRYVASIALAIVMLIGFSGVGRAQDKTADNMELVKQKIRTDKKLFVAENMQLTEDQAKAFWPVYDSYQADLEKHFARMGKLIETYAQNYANMSDDTAKNLLEEWFAIDADKLELRQSYLPKFRAVLPEIKVVRYFQIENKIEAVGSYALAAKIPLFK